MPGTDAQAETFIDQVAASPRAASAATTRPSSTSCATCSASPRRDPAVADDAENAYVFDRTVTSRDGKGGTAPGFIDLYKRDCFILEAKQGSETPRSRQTTT